MAVLGMGNAGLETYDAMANHAAYVHVMPGRGGRGPAVSACPGCPPTCYLLAPTSYLQIFCSISLMLSTIARSLSLCGLHYRSQRLP